MTASVCPCSVWAVWAPVTFGVITDKAALDTPAPIVCGHAFSLGEVPESGNALSPVLGPFCTPSGTERSCLQPNSQRFPGDKRVSARAPFSVRSS